MVLLVVVFVSRFESLEKETIALRHMHSAGMPLLGKGVACRSCQIRLPFTEGKWHRCNMWDRTQELSLRAGQFKKIAHCLSIGNRAKCGSGHDEPSQPSVMLPIVQKIH